MLAIAASLASAGRVIGIDVDADALALPGEMPQPSISEVARLGASTGFGRRYTTPVFDRRRDGGLESSVRRTAGNRHADRAFLETARAVADVSYTIHNEGSQEFVESFAADKGGDVTHAFRASFSIDRRFEFHTADRDARGGGLSDRVGRVVHYRSFDDSQSTFAPLGSPFVTI